MHYTKISPRPHPSQPLRLEVQLEYPIINGLLRFSNTPGVRYGGGLRIVWRQYRALHITHILKRFFSL